MVAGTEPGSGSVEGFVLLQGGFSTPLSHMHAEYEGLLQSQ